jgi:hypothetical protein
MSSLPHHNTRSRRPFLELELKPVSIRCSGLAAALLIEPPDARQIMNVMRAPQRSRAEYPLAQEGARILGAVCDAKHLKGAY